MIAFLITIVVMAISLWIISKLPIGVEVDSPGAALAGGAIIGAISGIWHLFPNFFQTANLWAGVLSLGLIPLIVSAIVFGLAAWLVQGFRLRWGVWSAILGAIALGLVNSILSFILDKIGVI
jgi:putative membrane protein